ncbi:MAG: acetylxylan esterase [Anaerolineales bacterium]|nr:acetylxylan esterase [Anaerolineales bacterium]
MPAYDLPLAELYRYRPERNEPPDFDDFWQATITESGHHPITGTAEPVDFGLAMLETYDVTFSGWGGQPVKGWLIIPSGLSGPAPCVIEFPSYGGGRGFPVDWLTFPCAGYVYFVMDNRGQGSGWRQGDTADLAPEGNSPHTPGVMTLGILDRESYFYRRLFVDALRACRWIKSLPAVNPERIAVTGMSQGGAVSLMAAALEPDLSAVMPDVTFLANFRRATQMVDTPPYNEISLYCQIHRDQVDKVFKTLSYFDVVNFAVRATPPALFSVGLMDTIAPPSTVFAAYNWYGGEKEIKVWPYNGHEGGGSYQTIEKIDYLRRLWK